MSFKAQAGNSLIVIPPQQQYMPQVNLMQQNMMAPPNMMQEMLLPNNPMMPGMPMPGMIATGGNEMSIQQGNITLVGNKTKPSNMCCFLMTILCGSFFIFPLCFMCCMWWKKIAYPTYELSIDAYHTLANFISRAPNMNNLNLTVVDNAFNAKKAGILHECLSRSRITGFTFNNRSLHCNGQFNEADDFRANMTPIKTMNISTSITWGDMIV
jgi:hypothetical protein